MKKFKIFIASIAMAGLLFLGGCGGNQQQSGTNQPEPQQPAEQTETAKYEDGIYFAVEDFFGGNGWKYFVTLEVKDGKIASAEWNGVHIEGGKDKLTRCKDGEYTLPSDLNWDEQAKRAVDYLLEKQDPTAISYTDDEGHTDDIAGVTIHVKEFFDLAKKALDNGPVPKGQYKDGIYYAAESEFNKGWKYMASIIVVNGTIVGADWNGINEDSSKPNKDQQSISGDYALPSDLQWHEQAQRAEQFLLEKQDPTAISYTDDEGHTDDIAGVTIHVKEFFDLAQKALEGAK